MVYNINRQCIHLIKKSKDEVITGNHDFAVFIVKHMFLWVLANFAIALIIIMFIPRFERKELEEMLELNILFLGSGKYSEERKSLLIALLSKRHGIKPAVS